MPDSTTGPDYELDDRRDIASPAELKAIGNEIRQAILALLAQQAATTSGVAEALGRPRGTVGHHLKVLEAAGMVRVVRTRKVRAMTEKYYGRTARTFYVRGPVSERRRLGMLEQAIGEARPDPGDGAIGFTLRHALIPEDRAEECMERLVRVAEEFASSRPGGERVYGLIAGIYPTDLPAVRPGSAE